MALIKQPTSIAPAEVIKQEVVVAEDTRDTKTKQIQAQGVIQASLQSPVLQLFATDFNNYMELVEKAAIRALKFVQDNSK